MINYIVRLLGAPNPRTQDQAQKLHDAGIRFLEHYTILCIEHIRHKQKLIDHGAFLIVTRSESWNQCHTARLQKSTWLMKPKYHVAGLIDIPGSKWKCIVCLTVASKNRKCRSRSWPIFAKIFLPFVPWIISCIMNFLCSVCGLFYCEPAGVDLQGVNPRYQHTYLDEDSMRWVKGHLSLIYSPDVSQ